ncbi:unannotated protein [freshwater metagenome]|uniref:Unannotated protein n=1 Tax=freshwater metagenome TaxID=449393 RepID=A0A6J6BBC2_9ZZZZ
MRSSISARSAINNSLAGIFARNASTTLLRPATASALARVSNRDSGLRPPVRGALVVRFGAASASRRFLPGRISYLFLYFLEEERSR